MSLCSKSFKCLRNLSVKEVLPRAGYVLDSTRILRIQNSNQNTIRNISTSKSFWANISFNLSDIGEGIREVVVKEWFVKVGDRVSQFDNICEVQSDKASVTITSRYDGTITKLYYNIDGIALVGKPLVDIETGENEGSEDNGKEELTNNKNPVETQDLIEETAQTIYDNNPKDYKKTLCIPSVRRLAKEHSIDLSKINGTGKDGRVLKEDVLGYLEETTSNRGTPKIQHDSISGERVEKITGFKKVMVKTMTEALKIPHMLYCDEISVTKLNQIRQAIKSEATSSGVKLTVLSFFIKAISNALRKYPILNSSLDSSCENIIYKNAHNIGVAMDTDMGLAVPVIKNVDKLTILEIASELNRLITLGKQGSFNPSDLSGGTFTISNIGIVGGSITGPIILSPQVAIVAIGEIKVLPRFDSSNKVVPEEIISLSGSADHRIVDGATMARFVSLVKKQLENPYLLFLYT